MTPLPLRCGGREAVIRGHQGGSCTVPYGLSELGSSQAQAWQISCLYHSWGPHILPWVEHSHPVSWSPEHPQTVASCPTLPTSRPPDLWTLPSLISHPRWHLSPWPWLSVAIFLPCVLHLQPMLLSPPPELPHLPLS